MSPSPPAFEALDNFRDYGGYARAPAGRLAGGRLFRSAHHANLTDADLARIAALDFAAVVDLRRPSERRRQPSRRPENFGGDVIENDHDEDGEAPHLTFLKTSDLTEASARNFMIETYRRLPFEAAHLDLFGRYFQALAEAEGPVLIHCAAGKDRTGLLAALTHMAMGVGEDDVMADYLRTNTAVDLAGRAPDIARQLEQWTGRRPSDAAVVAFMGVEPDFLKAAVDAIVARHGSTHAYLAEALGVTPERRDRIAERLCA